MARSSSGRSETDLEKAHPVLFGRSVHSSEYGLSSEQESDLDAVLWGEGA